MINNADGLTTSEPDAGAERQAKWLLHPTTNREATMSEKQELFATARVSITVEVDAASWDVKSSADQIFTAAGREAEQRLGNLLMKERGIRLVGKPIVTLVTGRRP